jgi:hypothetical protein
MRTLFPSRPPAAELSGVGTETRLSQRASILVIGLLSALCWAVLISICVALWEVR